MPFAEWDDIRLFYEQRGEGPRLLLISGTNGDLGRRPSVLESPLARRFDLLAGSTCFVSETRCHCGEREARRSNLHRASQLCLREIAAAASGRLAMTTLGMGAIA